MIEDIKDKLNNKSLLDKKDGYDLIEHCIDRYDIDNYIRDYRILPHNNDGCTLGLVSHSILTIYWEDILRTAEVFIKTFNKNNRNNNVYLNYMLVSSIIHEIRHCYQNKILENRVDNYDELLLKAGLLMYKLETQDDYDKLYINLPYERDAYCFSQAETIDLMSKLYNIENEYFKDFIGLEKVSLLYSYDVISGYTYSPFSKAMHDEVKINREIVDTVKKWEYSSRGIPLYYKLILGLDIKTKEYMKVLNSRIIYPRKSVRSKLLRLSDKV